MTKLQKVLAIGALVIAVGATSITAFAANNTTAAETVAGLTGKTVDSVIAERSETGKTYGAIANDAGKLTEYKAQILEERKSDLSASVAAGTMTQERADQIIAALELNQSTCDGTGSAKIGQNKGAGFGGMNGNCDGQGRGQGGAGRGQGNCGVIKE